MASVLIVSVNGAVDKFKCSGKVKCLSPEAFIDHSKYLGHAIASDLALIILIHTGKLGHVCVSRLADIV